MRLQTIFAKDIERTIEGVIKADDISSLRTEAEEYVLTREVEQELEKFLNEYSNSRGNNGVWISGFFGSGKSHLLKMLAYLLENHTFRDENPVDFFTIFEPKCSHNAFLRASLKKALSIPSESILFNIDQKADVTSKESADALLSVFMKVFNEQCGYYGKQGYIAQFERDLDNQNMYETFKTSYAQVAGKPWHRGRELAVLEGKNITKAYALATESDPDQHKDLLKNYREQYSLSIEDFAILINEYISRKPSNFRLNFFVDEVGQFIAQSVQLMTNLQTIAESLATKCRGRAWIIVTAQADMDAVVGEIAKEKGNDFSKIQGRFETRMKLTSQNVGEVIQKRLLLKSNASIQDLTAIYSKEVNNFRTLFDFTDSSRSYKNFQDEEDFVYTYPFIPYQFSLFQAAIKGLSEHNALEGRHSSVGERSMLSVFQHVLLEMKDQKIGELASFDLMFTGIRNSMKSQVQTAISSAENHLENPFAIKLLKALLLVKYVREFKPTIHNLCILMRTGFTQNEAELKKNIEQALIILEQQTYIQRKIDQYEYLTNEEKDIEEEIKSVDIDEDEVLKKIKEIFFDRIIKTPKIRHIASGSDYAFSKKLDGTSFDREHELAINFITPAHPHADSLDLLRADSISARELCVVLNADRSFTRDVRMLKQTEKYIQQNTSSTNQASIARILDARHIQNTELEHELFERANKFVGSALLIVQGNDVDIPHSEDGQSRIHKAFQELVVRIYTNLAMLREVVYSETDVAKHLQASDYALIKGDAMSEAESDLLAFMVSTQNKGERVTTKSILEKFEYRPYGWPRAAILCQIAKLHARGKLIAMKDGHEIQGKVLAANLCNNREHSNVLFTPQASYTESQKRALKTFFKDFFDSPIGSTEAKEMVQELIEGLKKRKVEIHEYLQKKDEYPFVIALEPLYHALQRCIGQQGDWYFNDFTKEHNSLLDMKDDIFEPIAKFMEGSQRGIYNEAVSLLKVYDHELSYSNPEEVREVQAILQSPVCYKGKAIQELKAIIGTLRVSLDTQRDLARATAQEELEAMQDCLCKMPEFSMLTPEQQDRIRKPFKVAIKDLQRHGSIPLIRNFAREFKESRYHVPLAQVLSWSKTAPETVAPPATPKPTAATLSASATKVDGPVPSPKQVEPSVSPTIPKVEPEAYPPFVSSSAIKVAFAKPWLLNQDDVENYVQAMKDALMDEIRKGKGIQL